ncbi:hypothetical protein BJ741DRAFT_626953 [Chytriomyces cf. hyalinus JEL632]|nr:hypothetical protein BJ741DRAFT_626953 [Chytriomyces cf. hyalinus JEL632]
MHLLFFTHSFSLTARPCLVVLSVTVIGAFVSLLPSRSIPFLSLAQTGCHSFFFYWCRTISRSICPPRFVPSRPFLFVFYLIISMCPPLLGKAGLLLVW